MGAELPARRSSVDLRTNVRGYLDDRKPNERYASFDYCFNYFQSFRELGKISAMASPANVEHSCIQLGFYLASWGMLRGSAELLKKSARYFRHVIEVVANTEPSLWELDAHLYTESNIQRLWELANKIRQAHPDGAGDMSDTLVTKIMLGVFGSVPAFDTNFKQGCRAEDKVATFSLRALREIGQFYMDKRAAIDEYRVRTLDFVSGGETQRLYTRAKVIDMAFFIEGNV